MGHFEIIVSKSLEVKMKSFTKGSMVNVDGSNMFLVPTYGLDMDNVLTSRIKDVAARAHARRTKALDPMNNDGAPIICYATGLVHTTDARTVRLLRKIGCRLRKRPIVLPIPDKAYRKAMGQVGGMYLL